MRSLYSPVSVQSHPAVQPKTSGVILAAVIVLWVAGCAAPNVSLFPGSTEPLKEYTLQGQDREKILIIPVNGVISDKGHNELFFTKPSMLQEVVSMLRKAEKDRNIRAVILKVNSPGGSTTTSDILYNEILRFKQRTGIKLIVMFMDIAASGGYYISLPADYIIAHPTSLTGSVGVIFIRPQFSGLMEKIGVEVYVEKSGDNKDMGSMFRQPTNNETEIFNGVTSKLGRRFLSLVAKHRAIDQDALSKVASGRIFLAEEALDLGLVDRIGYLNDAVLQAKQLAYLPRNPRIVVYRRVKYPNDTLYNTSVNHIGSTPVSLINLGVLENIAGLQTGFYYLWSPSVSH